MRHRCRCAVSRITRIRLFPLFFHNGCSQSSRFLPQVRRIAGSGDENAGYHEVFSGLGNHKYIKAKLIVNQDFHPVAHKQRSIPYKLAQKAAKEEQRLKELGIIEAVPDSQLTIWCINPMIAQKPHNPEAILFCSDMRVPNTAILRPVTEAQTIKLKLEGSTVFSVLDMNEGYHQVELDEDHNT